MARSTNVALRGSTALAVRPRDLETRSQAEKDLLSVLMMP
jgi:hypothetical protein